MPNVSKEHKNNVFCLLYQDRKRLLSLYNAMNGSDYKDENDLKVVTLEHSICMRMKNDSAFLICGRLNLYEHQGSVNDNIPLRDLYYVVEEYKKTAPLSTLYKRRSVKIPTPHFVVFYNGREPQPEKRVLRLSDLYEVETETPELELVVTQYNINAGYNVAIKEKCESLQEYMVFVDKVRCRTEEGMPIEQAVQESVDECIEENTLADFFLEHKNEVVEMGIFEFDEELWKKYTREEGWEDGLAEGKILNLIEQTCRKLAKNKPVEVIADELETDAETIRKICDVAANYAPEYDAEKILEEYKKL